MKIAIPVNGDRKTICISFGRTPKFLFLDTETNEREFVYNDAMTASGGAGIKAAQLMVDKGVDALLTPRLGENAVKVLEAASIKMYQTETQDLEAEIQKYLDGKMEVLTNIHAGFHGHGFAD